MCSPWQLVDGRRAILGRAGACGRDGRCDGCDGCVLFCDERGRAGAGARGDDVDVSVGHGGLARRCWRELESALRFMRLGSVLLNGSCASAPCAALAEAAGGGERCRVASRAGEAGVGDYSRQKWSPPSLLFSTRPPAPPERGVRRSAKNAEACIELQSGFTDSIQPSPTATTPQSNGRTGQRPHPAYPCRPFAALKRAERASNRVFQARQQRICSTLSSPPHPSSSNRTHPRETRDRWTRSAPTSAQETTA